MTDIFDSVVNDLFHLPETLDKLVVYPALSRVAGDKRAGSSLATGAGDGGRAHRGGVHVSGGGAPVDIVETPVEYTFYLDVPGLSKSDIQVTLDDERVLVIKSNTNNSNNDTINNGGKRKREEEEGECVYLRLERRFTPPKFLRKFSLPEDSDVGAITARCEHGVLTVTVKKLPPPEKKTKTVQVTVA